MIVKNDLFDYENRYIYQDSNGFKFSVDSILLAEYANFTFDDKNVLDLCTGNASVPLIMSTYNKSHYVGFEIQKDVYDLGVLSINYNKLDKQIMIYNDDVNNISKYFKKGYFDIITCNPPFFKVNDVKVVNSNEKKALARHEITFHLEDAFKIASQYLNDKGILYIVQRANRLDELFLLAVKYNLHIKKLSLVSTKKEEKPSIVLVKCLKNSKMGVVIDSQICIDNLKSYKHLFKEN